MVLIQEEIQRLANFKKAKILQGFFKTAKGEYGEGDIFLGLTVPQSRQIARNYENLPIKKVAELLHSKIHEERLIALIILVYKFQKASKEQKKEIFNCYLRNTKFINNWDLVDLSARDIIGGFLFDKPRNILYKLAVSKNIWERRIAIIATYFFIQKGEFKNTIKISELLLKDKHDLIHKAVGWMLREVGKKDQKILVDFLQKHYKIMPRTMLRYAIEKFPFDVRRSYIEGKI